MKMSFLRSTLLIALIVAGFGFSRLLFGQDTTDMLSKALDLVHQVENPTVNPPTDAQRIDLLTQAITMAQKAPNHRLKGHRVLAIQAIRSAVTEIRAGDPNHQAATYIHTADMELSTSISLAGAVEPTVATPSTLTSITNTTVAKPTTPISPDASAEIIPAVEDGDLNKVKALLQKNPDLVFSKGKDGETPLLKAVSAGHQDIAELLLANKADVNAKDNSSQTPLHFAAQGDDTDDTKMAALLLAKGADIHAKDNDGNTPLLDAASDGNKNMAELLLTKGADIEAKDNSGCTPLIWAAIQGHRDVAEVLLDHKADVNAKSPSSGQTALSSAAMNGHKDIAELLLANHADLQGADQCGQTPLDWAVDNGHLEMVEFLLAQGADVNAKAKDGSTPLHLAEVHHNYDVAALLRQHGGKEPAGMVDTGASSGTGDASTDPASLDAAARAGDLDKVKSLIKANPNSIFSTGDGEFTPLVAAAARNHKDVVKFLLANKADINVRSEIGMTALAVAARDGDKEMADLLIAHGADVNARDKNGHTPLHEAMNQVPWHKDVATLLLAHGADPNIGDNEGETPLHEAAGWIRADKVEFLLGYKVDVNARDKNGDTPLYIAISDGARDDIAKVLLAHGADASIKGHDGLTPREVTLKKGDHDMARILSNPAATLGTPPAPVDGIAPKDVIARFMANIAKEPPGPVENDVTEDVIQTMESMAELTKTNVSPRESIATGFHIFTLDSPVTEFYAQGLAAVYEGNATLTEAAAKEFQDDYDQSSASWTDQGKPVTDKGPFLMFGPGAADFTDAKVPADRRVIVSFCLVQQHGHWKVHCLYFSNAPLAGDHKDFVIKQLAAFSRKQGG
jgi:ankyrin repeat protein